MVVREARLRSFVIANNVKSPLACAAPHLRQVVVLEARNRIGGRAFTDYSFGFPLDLGAA
ncbi:unnamed protein product, partial [Closterium sp. NIES-53]